jgi:hypothetical protein
MDNDFLPGYEKIVFKKPKAGFKYNTLKFLRNFLLSIFILLVIAVNAGIFFTWYANKNKASNTVGVSQDLESNTMKKPAQQSKDIRVGVAMQTLDPTAKPGGLVYIAVHTNNNADCSIDIKYNDVSSKNINLIPKKADDYGSVSWSFNLEPTAPVGTWPVRVTCSNGKSSGVAGGNIIIK